MDKILHDPKDPKLWELWYIPYYGSCRILSISRRHGRHGPGLLNTELVHPKGGTQKSAEQVLTEEEGLSKNDGLRKGA